MASKLEAVASVYRSALIIPLACHQAVCLISLIVEGVPMNVSLTKLVSRILIMCMLALPFQSAQAVMVGTDQVVSTAQSQQQDRDKIRNFVARADVRQQLEAMGIKGDTAADRVAAMTDEEVENISGQIDALPAGAMSGWAWAAVVVAIAAVVYLFYLRK